MKNFPWALVAVFVSSLAQAETVTVPQQQAPTAQAAREASQKSCCTLTYEGYQPDPSKWGFVCGNKGDTFENFTSTACLRTFQCDGQSWAVKAPDKCLKGKPVQGAPAGGAGNTNFAT